MSADPVARVVFCGTAGSGKTTVGALVARALGRDFVDIDRVVERAAGKTVPATRVADASRITKISCPIVVRPI